MDTENEDNDNSSSRKDQEMEESNYLITSRISRAKKILESIENVETSEYKDINNKLSDYAQDAVQDSKGPLKPDKLFKFVMNDVLGRKNKDILASIRKYSNDINGVREQLSQVLDRVETHMKYRKKQKELDDRFIKKFKKLDKTINEAMEEEMRPKQIQRTLNQYFNAENIHFSEESREVNGGNNTRQMNVSEISASSSQMIFGKHAEKGNRKRKSKNSSRKSRKSDNGIAEVMFGINKCLKLSSPGNSIESSTESMTAESDGSCRHAELMLLAESDKSSDHHVEPMSVVNSEGSNSQPDEMSANDSRKNIKKRKSFKLSRTSSEQPMSRLTEDASEYNKNEETFPERRFCLRGGTSRPN